MEDKGKSFAGKKGAKLESAVIAQNQRNAGLVDVYTSTIILCFYVGNLEHGFASMGTPLLELHINII